MAIQTATTYWEGDPVEGRGLMILGSGHLDEPYSFSSRFGDGKGTSPEELLGAAHSGSFSMALAQELAWAGFSQVKIQTSAKVCINNVENEFRIALIFLDAKVQVADISPDKFTQCVNSARRRCLVSNVLVHTEVELVANIVNAS